MKYSVVLVIGLCVAFEPASASIATCLGERPVSSLPLTLSVPEWQGREQSASRCLTAEHLVARLRLPTPAVQPAGAVSSAAYVPKTRDDNTPWRFDMNQNGKRMTAEEFDAWMKAKGIRVATGKPTPTHADGTESCQPNETTTAC